MESNDRTEPQTPINRLVPAREIIFWVLRMSYVRCIKTNFVSQKEPKWLLFNLSKVTFVGVKILYPGTKPNVILVVSILVDHVYGFLNAIVASEMATIAKIGDFVKHKWNFLQSKKRLFINRKYALFFENCIFWKWDS